MINGLFIGVTEVFADRNRGGTDGKTVLSGPVRDEKGSVGRIIKTPSEGMRSKTP